MRAERKNRLRFPSILARPLSLALAVAFGVYFGAQGPAQSQIESRKLSAPFSSSFSDAHVSERPALPKAPLQVEMPAPPPIKYFAGLEEPLVATGPVTQQEGRDLDAALNAFHEAPLKAPSESDYADYAKPLIAFLETHPKSNWNAALYLDLGLGYLHAGYYNDAFASYEKSWQRGRDATNPQARLMVDRAVGELARMHARVGHAEELESLFKDIGKRPIGGPATELIQGAHEGLWSFHHNPAEAYLCGPRALKNVLTALKAAPKQIKIADDARSGKHGFSLHQLAKLADKAKFKYTLVHRDPGQPVPVPSIVNWSVHHYAAIIGTQANLYQVQDPTFGEASGSLLTAQAIDAGQSGYFLVPDSVMKANPKAGWRTVAANSSEANAVYGMGATQIDTPACIVCDLLGGLPSKTDDRSGRPPQMTIAQTQPMNVSLHLSDTPVGYETQKGVPALTRLTYNARETDQPATLAFGNVSAKWTHSWTGWVWDDPTTNREGWNVRRYASGGGGYDYENRYDRATGSWPPETRENSEMWRTPVLGVATNYEHRLPDGSKENFTLSDGATTWPRKLFMTSVTDVQGNVTTLNYDSSFRLTSVVDAMGRTTTFTYGLTGYPLLLTLITDPFGRTTQLTYDTSQRLASITDPIGITSSFTYSTTEPTFITQLTTPYGTSTFNDTPDPNDTPEPANDTRSLTLTDPMGYTDFYYFYQNSAVTPATDPRGVPTGMSTDAGGWLDWRNTYHWDPHEFALGATMSSGQVTSQDFTKCDILHWTHDRLTLYTARALGSIKHPLEGRMYYNYPSSAGYYNGFIDRPSIVGRILDDGTSQETKATYNTTNAWLPLPGNLLMQTDPKGRTTQYTYATNNIDLLTVQQLTTSPSTYTTVATYGSYNTQHEPQTYTDAAGQVWHYSYNTAGQLATVTDPNSGVTTYNYDGSSRLSTIQNANLQTVLTLTYDSADRIRTRTDSEGYALTYAYDNLDRVTSITYPDGTTDLYDYTFQSGPNAGTPSLELRKYTDRMGRVTTRDYDADRRLISVTEPISGGTTRTTQYAYYENGALKNLTDANGNVTHWDIDLQSRPTAKTYAYGTASAKTESYTYETYSSRLKSTTDALGQKKAFTYGLDNRITGITYTSSVNATPNVTFAYDTYFPRLTSMADGTGTTTYGYTAIGTNGALKLSSIAGPYSNDTIGLTYDTLGRLSGRNITGGNETFGYDAISRMTSHGTPLGSFTYGYLGQTDQTASRSVTNGGTTVSTSWGFDTNTNDRRLISIANSGITRSYTLGYGSGPVNPYDIMSITDTAATGHPFATQSHSYTYDNVDRLLTANQTTPGNNTYAYDNLDNATTVTNPTGTITPAPTYNVNNQLATWASNSYSYDANGNTLSGDGTKTYKWDAENRLIEIDYVGTSNKTVFTYNGSGQRRVQADTVSGTTTTTRYLWCTSLTKTSPLRADHICQSRDNADNVLKRHTSEGEYNISTTQKLVYMPDQIGSVRDVLDATTGGRVASYDYSPNGTLTQSSVTNGTDFQYAGLFYHANSGMLLSATRAFDPITGRWINRDPIREIGGINLYAYTAARSINRTDPWGLMTFPSWLQGTPEQREYEAQLMEMAGYVAFSGSGLAIFFVPEAFLPFAITGVFCKVESLLLSPKPFDPTQEGFTTVVDLIFDDTQGSFMWNFWQYFQMILPQPKPLGPAPVPFPPPPPSPIICVTLPNQPGSPRSCTSFSQ